MKKKTIQICRKKEEDVVKDKKECGERVPYSTKRPTSFGI